MDTLIHAAEIAGVLFMLFVGLYFFKLAASERGNRPDVRRRPNW